MKLAEVLMGTESLKVFGLSFGRNKPGLLAPISKFSEILMQFAGGNGKTIPLLDENGKKIKDVQIEDVAKNIISGLNTFTTQLGNENIIANTEKAEKNIGKFSDLMETTNKIAKSLDGMSKLSMTVKDLAEGIGLLAVNVDKLNSEKLSQIIDKANSASSRSLMVNSSSQEEVSNSRKSGSSYSEASAKEIDWDRISAMIGDQVGQRVAAVLKNGQFTFEFNSSKNNEGVFYLQPR